MKARPRRNHSVMHFTEVLLLHLLATHFAYDAFSKASLSGLVGYVGDVARVGDRRRISGIYIADYVRRLCLVDPDFGDFSR